jgi:nucleoside permease NupC
VIFLGQSEAPLLIQSYLKRLTRSELFAVMTGGFASVAGSTLVGYPDRLDRRVRTRAVAGRWPSLA